MEIVKARKLDWRQSMAVHLQKVCDQCKEHSSVSEIKVRTIGKIRWYDNGPHCSVGVIDYHLRHACVPSGEARMVNTKHGSILAGGFKCLTVDAFAERLTTVIYAVVIIV